MGNRESDVEKHLHKKIEAIGGTTRKWVSPGRIGVMDRLVFNTITVREMMYLLSLRDPDEPFANIELVEVKTEIGKLSSMQEREKARLEKHGATVRVVYGKKGVDLYVEKLSRRSTPNFLIAPEAFNDPMKS